jgi:hypothetical protein
MIRTHLRLYFQPSTGCDIQERFATEQAYAGLIAANGQICVWRCHIPAKTLCI